MGHGHILTEAHRALVKRLEAGTAAFPEPEEPRAREAWKEILEILFTPEEAALASRMPVKPASLEQLTIHFKIKPEELKARLDKMCDKALIVDLINPETGQAVYVLSPPIVGFVEFSMMRAHDSMPKKQLAEAFEAYMHGDDTFVREVFAGKTTIGRTLVHETALGEESLPEVLDWERATAIIENASAIAVSLCYCRHKNFHLGSSCAAPLENCLSINSGADFVIRRSFGRALGTTEALEILHAARENGLVHIADNVAQSPAYICSCCGCCCGQLQTINRYSLPAVTPSGFSAACDRQLCTGCSRCSKACPIAAITMTAPGPETHPAGKPVSAIDADRCIGCGICAHTCSSGAMTMVRRSRQPRIPRNSLEKVIRMMLERGRLPHLLFDQSMGRSSYFLNRLLAALCALPPIEKMLASEQLQSRFVRFVLSRVQNPAGYGNKHGTHASL